MQPHPVPPATAVGPVPSDFFLEFYKLHRAHEVALNNATAAYEQALLRLILVFNAASAGAFLGIMQAAEKKSSIHYDFNFARGALISWVVGVGLAFTATFLGYRSQRGFTQAYRARRQAEEAVRMAVGTTANALDWPGRLGIGVKERAVPRWTLKAEDRLARGVAGRLIADADKARDQSIVLQRRALWLGGFAVAAALAGFVLALSSVQFGSPTPNLYEEVTSFAS